MACSLYSCTGFRYSLGSAQEKANYDLHHNDPADPRYRAFLNRLAEPLLARLQPGMDGLDYGCGPGPALSSLLREAGMVIHDYDALYVLNSGLLERQYDFVTCTEVEHFNDPGSAWPLLAGRVRAGGWLGIMTWLVPRRSPKPFAAGATRGNPPTSVFIDRPPWSDWDANSGLPWSDRRTRYPDEQDADLTVV